MKILRALLLATAWIIGSLVLVIALFAGWMALSGSSIGKRATAFCEEVPIGLPVTELEAKAEAADAIYLPGTTHPHAVRFTGWGQAECRLTVVDGRVTAKEAFFEEYD